MESDYGQLSISRIFSLILYTLATFSSSEAEIISANAGSTVNLQCNDSSISTVRHLIWIMNWDQHLFIYTPKEYRRLENLSLSFNMSWSESQLYALIIDRAEKSHTGNYTCQTTTDTGKWERNWELRITDPEESESWAKSVIMVTAIIPCVCFLTFVIALTIMVKSCRKCADHQSPPTDVVQQQEEEIYENCLNDGHNRPHIYLPRTCPYNAQSKHCMTDRNK